MKRLPIIGFLSALLFVAACSESTPPVEPPPSGADVTVRMDDIAFIDPQDNRNQDAVVTIEVGETVRWENEDSVPHTVTSSDGSDELDSGNLAPGEDYEVTFNTPGTYVYLCELHEGTMFDARVIVE